MLNLVLVFVLVLKPKALYCLDAWNKLVFHSLPVIASLDTIKLVLVVLFFFQYHSVYCIVSYFQVLKSLKTRFKPGDGYRCMVLNVDKERNFLDLSIAGKLV